MDWAKEMGIDRELLKAEHPSHILQVSNRKKIMQKSEKFWAWKRFVDSAESAAGLIYLNAHGAEIPKNRVRVVKKSKPPAKVKRYEFTERQLEIARRVLNGEGSV